MACGVSDSVLFANRDWDPVYLSSIFDEEFYDFKDLWSAEIQDSDLLIAMENYEKYSPIVEDISLDDSTLCTAVEQIEAE